MKNLLACLMLLMLSMAQSFGLVGLTVSVMGANAVLTWPCNNNGETYLIQYRSNLTSTAWVTIADNVNPSGSNTTTFVDTSNIVTFPPIPAGSTNFTGGGSPTPPGPGSGTNAYDPSNTNFLISTTGFYQVVRDGAYIYGVTNGQLWTDFVTVPVELGNSFGSAGTMSLTENGSPVGNSIQSPGLTLTVNTTLMSNGVHSVSLSTSWTDTNGNYVEADSPPISVTVSNEISYPNWVANYGELGNSAVFSAQSLHTNANWQMDVYGSDYYYIGSFNGTTTDGSIYVVWNLADGNGVTHTNDTFFVCQISTTFDPNSGMTPLTPNPITSAATPPTYKVNDPWLGPGKFAAAVQHAWDTTTDHELLYEELNGFCGAAASAFGVLPTPSSGNPFPIPFSDDNGNNGNPAAGWSAFRSALYDPYVRNFIYFGHGGEFGLGYNTANTNVSILASVIGSVLHNIPAGQTNAHRFRFCFVDGCSTAKGQMPEAFGILHVVGIPSINYYYASLRPSCYCGWTSDKSIAYVSGSAINYGHVNFITHIQFEMLMNGVSISKAVSDAANYSDVTSTFTTTSDFQIYGCPEVTFSSNNN